MSNENQHTAGSRALQTDKETRGKHWPIAFLVIATILDRAITIVHFAREGNPIVTALGPGPWIALTGIVTGGAVIVWYYFRLFKIRSMKGLVTFAASMTFLGFVSNVFVVYLL